MGVDGRLVLGVLVGCLVLRVCCGLGWIVWVVVPVAVTCCGLLWFCYSCLVLFDFVLG